MPAPLSKPSRHLHALQPSALSTLAASVALLGLAPSVFAATADVYYATAPKNWAKVYMHYEVTSGVWTVAPGDLMGPSCPGFVQKTVDLGARASLQAAFNNGANTWDNAGGVAGGNYIIKPGITVVSAGAASYPSVSPCPTLSDTQAPTVPSGLAQTGVTTSSASFSWAASSDLGGGVVAGYKVLRNGTEIASVAANVLSYTDTGLAANTSYSYSVKAFDNAGTPNISAASSALSIKTLVNNTCTAGVDSDDDGVSDCTEALEGLNPLVKDNDLYAANAKGVRLFTMQQFRDLLLVEPYQPALDFWIGQISAGTKTKSQVVEAFYNSTASKNNLQPIGRLLFVLFGQYPSVNAYNNWGKQVTSGAMTVDQVADALAASNAFKAAYGNLTDTQFIQKLYVNAIGRLPTAAELDAWIGQIAFGLSRGGVALQIANDPGVSDLLANRLFVSTIYSTMARYLPADTGMSYWVGRLNTDAAAGRQELIKAFLGDLLPSYANAAKGYHDRFLPSDGVDVLPPTVPNGLTKLGADNSSISFKWNASSDLGGGKVGGYKIYRDGILLATVGSPVLNYVDTGLAANTTYKYQVLAFDNVTPKANESGKSIELAISTTGGGAVDTQAPNVPAQPVAGSVTSSSVSISWSAVSDNGGGLVAGYKVFRNGSPLANVTNGLSYTDTTVASNTAYSYTVSAYDNATAVNESAQSPALNVTTLKPADVLPPNVPAAPTAGTVASNSVTINWVAVSDNGGGLVAGYKVFRDGNLLSSVTSGLSYTDATAQPGTAYNYTVSAFDNASPANESAKSAALPVTTPALASQVKVYYYTGTNKWATVNMHYNLNGSWTTVPGKAMDEAACTDWKLKTVDLTGAAVSIQAAFNNGNNVWDSNGGKDYVLPKGINTVKDGVLSSNVASPCLPQEPDLLPPSVPGKPVADAVGAHSVQLSWAASIDNRQVKDYDIYRDGKLVGNSASPLFFDAGLTIKTTYQYTVIARDTSNNVSTASPALSVTTTDEVIIDPPKSGEPLGTDMREDSIYFVMTARFFDGDPTNNRGGILHTSSGNAANNDPMFRGDFKGLIQKLDYIKAMGFSAIWITPVVLNRSDYDFHGYHGWDFFRVDPRLESPGVTYQDLINAAHAKGIKIIQDVVYNHSTKYGAKGLSTIKYFGKRDSQWSSYYDAPNPAFEYNGLDAEVNSGKPYYNGDLWTEIAPEGNTCNNWGVADGQTWMGRPQYGCQRPIFNNTNTLGVVPKNFFHTCWLGNWEGEDAKSCWMHADLADLNTENAAVQKYLIDAYNKFIDMGVDGFRIDTMVHVHRNMWNKHFLPAAQQESALKFGEKGKNFYMVGEVAAFVNDKWNHGSPGHSPQFYTWKERKTYSADDAVAVHEMTAFEQAAVQPTSTNAFLQGNNYHTPDRSQCNGNAVIDMRMHMNFSDANNAFNNGKDSDDSYCDATYNVVYVDSHDYAPGKSDIAYNGGTDAWAENMDLMWTFRGIPTLFQGAEIEFQAGKKIDCGGDCPLATTRRAYFGTKIEGEVTASDFGVVGSATGTVATTLSSPLVKHVQRLNQIRRKIPALQKGQYSTEGVSGGIAYKRRFTDATKGVDSFALVAVSSSATFTGIPNGTYKDAVTGDTKVVSNGSLALNVSGKGNARIYVLDLPGNPAPGKIGNDGPYLKP